MSILRKRAKPTGIDRPSHGVNRPVLLPWTCTVERGTPDRTATSEV